jgi:hypothetical protein
MRWEELIRDRTPTGRQFLCGSVVESLRNEVKLRPSVPGDGATPNVVFHPPAGFGKSRIAILRVTNGHFYVRGNPVHCERHLAEVPGVTTAERDGDLPRYLDCFVGSEASVVLCCELVRRAPRDRRSPRTRYSVTQPGEVLTERGKSRLSSVPSESKGGRNA